MHRCVAGDAPWRQKQSTHSGRPHPQQRGVANFVSIGEAQFAHARAGERGWAWYGGGSGKRSPGRSIVGFGAFGREVGKGGAGFGSLTTRETAPSLFTLGSHDHDFHWTPGFMYVTG